MSDLLNEQLSALLDGELPPEETTLLLRRLQREPALAEQLARYRLCGDVLRGERAQARADFAMRVSAAIATEPALAAPAVDVVRAAARPSWMRAVGGFAVAAGVAAIAVLMLRHSPVLPPPAQPMASVAVRPSAAETATPVVSARPAATLALTGRAATRGTEPVSYVTPPARNGLGTIPQAALAHYVVAHSEVSSPLTRSSVLTNLVAGPRAADYAATDASGR